MANFDVCRVCLAFDRKTHVIKSTHLQEIFENLTKTKLNSEDGRPCTVCFICCALLQRCLRFVDTSQKAEAVLTQILCNNFELSKETINLHRTETANNYLITPMETYFTNDDESNDIGIVSIKKEKDEEKTIVEFIEVTLKEEPDDGQTNARQEQLIVEVQGQRNKQDNDGMGQVITEKARNNDKQPNKQSIAEDQGRFDKETDIFDLEQVISRIAQNIEKENIVKQEILSERILVKKEPVEPMILAEEEIHLKIEPYIEDSHETLIDVKIEHDSKELINKDLIKIEPNTEGNILNSDREDDIKILDGGTEECILIESDDDQNVRVRNEGIFMDDDEVMVQEITQQSIYIEDDEEYPTTRKVIDTKKKTELAQDVICKCDICNKTFKTIKILKRHMLQHGNKAYTCQYCEKSFATYSVLKRHLLIHTGEKPYACDTCHKKCDSKTELLEHMRVHTGEKPFSCEQCNKPFRTKSYLRFHVREFHGDKEKRQKQPATHTPQQCPVCEKTILTDKSFKLHMAKHSGKGPTCEKCGKSFVNKNSLTVHLRLHSGESPHSCTLCQKSFHTSSHLKIHLRTHAGEKAHECDVCGRRFNEKFHLNSHKIIHSEGKSLECKLCNQTFGRKETYLFHKQTRHPGPNRMTFACDLCEKTFPVKSYLRKHITCVHKSIWCT